MRQEGRSKLKVLVHRHPVLSITVIKTKEKFLLAVSLSPHSKPCMYNVVCFLLPPGVATRCSVFASVSGRNKTWWNTTVVMHDPTDSQPEMRLPPESVSSFPKSPSWGEKRAEEKGSKLIGFLVHVNGTDGNRKIGVPLVLVLQDTLGLEPSPGLLKSPGLYAARKKHTVLASSQPTQLHQYPFVHWPLALPSTPARIDLQLLRPHQKEPTLPSWPIHSRISGQRLGETYLVSGL